MEYNILETRVEFDNNNLSKVTVLVDCTGSNSKPYSDVRAIYVTTKPIGGYMFLLPNSTLTSKLLQEVAAAGLEAINRDKIFPSWKKRLTK